MPQPKDKDWLNGYKNKTPIYMLSTRDPLQNKGHIQTKSEGQDILLDSTLGQALDFGFCFPILKDYLLKDQGHLG